MWKPIQPPGEWLVFLQRKDIKGLPIMEARKRYMQEQLLFENYYSNLQTLNTINTVSPSVASAAAAAGGGGGGGGGPKRSIGPSGARGGGALSLFLEMDIHPTEMYWDRALGLSYSNPPSNYTPGLESELPQPFTINKWTFSDDPAWSTNAWTSAYYQNNFDQTPLPQPDTWVNGLPYGDDFDLQTQKLKNFVFNTDDNYLSVVSGSIRSGYDDYATEAYSSKLRELKLPITWDLEEPIRVDWGDGNINNYSGPQGYPQVNNGHFYTTTRYSIPYSSTDSSSRWSVESGSAYVNDKVWNHAYDIEHLVPESWVPFIPEPDTYYPRPEYSRNTYYRYAQETPITSSNGLFPWGTRFNDWYNWTPVTQSVKIYGNPLAGGNIWSFYNGKIRRLHYLDISKFTSFRSLFRDAQLIDLTPLNMSTWDTSHITNMSEMFRGSFLLGKDIKQNDLGNWDTSNVTNMSTMFGNYSGGMIGDPGDIGKWDVSNVTTMYQMFMTTIYAFQNTGHFLSSDLSNWDLSSVTTTTLMFFNNSAFQHNTQFNNWDVSNISSMGYMFGGSGFKERLTNWNLKDGVNMQSIFNHVAMSHTDFFETLKAWASGSASNVNMSDASSGYKISLGATPSLSLDKRNNGNGNTVPYDTPIYWNDTDFINLADFRKWFANYSNSTGVTLISGSSNHQAYETLLSRGWSMPGNIDILETGSIAANRITQVPIQVTVSGSQFVMSSSVFLPISEIQPYDNYDPLYTPTLTYRFDQSDASNTGHPLKFSETLDGTHGGGVEYTTDVTTVGTPGTSGSYTDVIVSNLNGFEVEYKPKLYTYCENHSGMSEFYLEAYV